MKRTILTGILAMAAGVLTLVAQPGQPAKGQSAQAKGPTVKSQAEAQAVMALQNAQNDPDATIKAAEDLLNRYADSDFKEAALFMEAHAYQTKRDMPKAQIFARRTLEVNPRNFSATMLLGEILSQTVRENDLDREDRLHEAEQYLNQTMEILKTASKPSPQLPDASWEEAKKDIVAECHSGLGLCQMTRKNYDGAIAEFQIAFQNDPQPAYQVRLASALQLSGKNDEAIAICDKVLADPQLHPQIRAVAQNVKNVAIRAKGAPAEVKKP